MSKNFIAAMIVILVVIGAVIYGTWHNKQYDLNILKSPAFSTGYFLSFTTTKSTGLEGHYSFKVNGATYGSGQTDGRYDKLGKEIFDQ